MEANQILKKCTKCGLEKPLESYGKAKYGKYGKRAECKACEHEYYLKNQEKIKAKASDNYYKDPQKVIDNNRKRKGKDPVAFAEKRKVWDNAYKFKDYKDYRKKKNSWQRANRAKNIEKAKAYSIEYYRKNHSVIREQVRTGRIRRRKDPLYRAKEAARDRLKSLLRKKGITLEESYREFGCTDEQLKKHLISTHSEEAFNNLGLFTYHIDHIFPLAKMNTIEQIQKANHYTNLQILWWETNLEKSDMLPEEWEKYKKSENYVDKELAFKKKL